jgi:hypothetical protein
MPNGVKYQMQSLEKPLKSCSHKGHVEGGADNSGFTRPGGPCMGLCESVF